MHVPTRPGSEPQEEVLLVVLQSTGGARTNGTKVNGSFFKVTPDNFSSLSVSWCQYRRRCCRQPDRFCFPQSQITTAQFSRLSEIDQQLTWAPRLNWTVTVSFTGNQWKRWCNFSPYQWRAIKIELIWTRWSRNTQIRYRSYPWTCTEDVWRCLCGCFLIKPFVHCVLKCSLMNLLRKKFRLWGVWLKSSDQLELLSRFTEEEKQQNHIITWHHPRQATVHKYMTAQLYLYRISYNTYQRFTLDKM